MPETEFESVANSIQIFFCYLSVIYKLNKIVLDEDCLMGYFSLLKLAILSRLPGFLKCVMAAEVLSVKLRNSVCIIYFAIILKTKSTTQPDIPILNY